MAKPEMTVTAFPGDYADTCEIVIRYRATGRQVRIANVPLGLPGTAIDEDGRFIDGMNVMEKLDWLYGEEKEKP